MMMGNDRERLLAWVGIWDRSSRLILPGEMIVLLSAGG